MMNDIIQIKQPIVRVDDIVCQEYHTYTPYTTSFNQNDEIRIAIQSQDLYVLPSQSYLSIEFTVSREGGVEIAPDTRFANMFIAHLFSEIRYELNGFEIDCCKKPGVTAAMKLSTALKSTDKPSMDLAGLHSTDQISATTYNMLYPLRFIFGFCEDYSKIILNSKHELIMVRSRTNSNMYTGANNADDLKFDVKKIQWKMPHVSLSDRARLAMQKTISRSDDLLLSYRSWDLYEIPNLPETSRHTWSVKTTSHVTKPRYVIVGFQTNRNQVVNRSVSEFDNCNIINMKLHLNNERYPYDDMDLDFAHFKYQELYHMYTKAQSSYYNNAGGLNPIALSYANFASIALFVFDCSKNEDGIKPGMVDVRLDFEARDNFPARTAAFCLIIHDNLVRYSPFTSVVRREF